MSCNTDAVLKSLNAHQSSLPLNDIYISHPSFPPNHAKKQQYVQYHWHQGTTAPHTALTKSNCNWNVYHIQNIANPVSWPVSSTIHTILPTGKANIVTYFQQYIVICHFIENGLDKTKSRTHSTKSDANTDFWASTTNLFHQSVNQQNFGTSVLSFFHDCHGHCCGANLHCHREFQAWTKLKGWPESSTQWATRSTSTKEQSFWISARLF